MDRWTAASAQLSAQEPGKLAEVGGPQRATSLQKGGWGWGWGGGSGMGGGCGWPGRQGAREEQGGAAPVLLAAGDGEGSGARSSCAPRPAGSSPPPRPLSCCPDALCPKPGLSSHQSSWGTRAVAAAAHTPRGPHWPHGVSRGRWSGR